MNGIFELKQRIKDLSTKQKQVKAERKQSYSGKRTVTSSCWSDHNAAAMQATSNKIELRHLHIAYCLLRGRAIEQIEPKTKPCHLKEGRDMGWVEKLKEEYGYEEALRDSA